MTLRDTIRDAIYNHMFAGSHFPKDEADCCADVVMKAIEGMVKEIKLPDPKPCANEKCGKWFIYHEGRTKTGQHRRDAKYCSVSCAQSKVQKEYRRRKKEMAG